MKNIKIISILILFMTILCVSGCQNNDPQIQTEIVYKTENLVNVYPPNNCSDTIIAVQCEDDVQAKVTAYILNDDNTAWETLFSVDKIELNSPDYIGIRNNYGEYDTVFVGVGTTEMFDPYATNQISFKEIKHNMLIYTSNGFTAESTHEMYDDLNKNHPSEGEYYFFNDYSSELGKEQVIGYQFIPDESKTLIDSAFRNQLKEMTFENVDNLPSRDTYGDYELVMVTLTIYK